MTLSIPLRRNKAAESEADQALSRQAKVSVMMVGIKQKRRKKTA